MALPTPTPSGFVQIPNRGFEEGATGWNTAGSANIVEESAMTGSWCVKATGSGADGAVTTSNIFPVVPGQSLSLTVACYMPDGSPGTSVSADFSWYDSNGNLVSTKEGTEVTKKALGNNKGTASVNATVPVGVAGVRPRSDLNVATSSTIYVDDFSWNYNFPVTITISSPNASTYQNGGVIPYRISSTLPSGVSIQSVKYYAAEYDGSDYDTPVLVAEVTDSPFAYNEEGGRAEGTYGVYAEVTLSTGLKYITASRNFSVGEAIPPDTREYRASNSGAFLVMENFSGLAAALPSTALVTGAELVVGYGLEVLSRVKDKDIEASASNPDTVFSIITGGTLTATLLKKNSDSYSTVGNDMSADIAITRSDFTLDEEGISEGYKWVTFESNSEFTATLGADDLLFGSSTMSVQDFIERAVGLSFRAITGTIPPTADSGNACVRFKCNTAKLRVYFDAGSIDYYFASPDKSGVLKGVLVSSNVLDGDLRNGDAVGVLQLRPKLEIVEGNDSVILDNWTVHSQYPVTGANQIAVVDGNMQYNGLPAYASTEVNRSRYQFITSNFYGDERLNSIYGVNGVGRAFSFNGTDFYKIYTQPEADKDVPRHIAEHHLHLALGYAEGRVDVSVVGEPYNFDGSLGASSWGIGDGVTGLLKLSGTILGVFGSNSISGLSGTTVDNFNVQTISPKMGAIEYTVVDMSYPVYANSYGIYTLSQTEQYGDYLGTPLSQDISPWLRPRLVRKNTNDKEVVVSWPVRSKNQYRLAFADGYILTMTMNNGQQSSPTFSTQKYFLNHDDEPAPELRMSPVVTGDKYDQPSFVPAAVSSQLDDGGQERIHMAPKPDMYIETLVFYGPEIFGNAPAANIGFAYDGFTYTVDAGDAPVVSVDIVGGKLPAGLTWDNGTISATAPTEKGSFTITIRATDSNGLWYEHTDTIFVGSLMYVLASSHVEGLWISRDLVEWSSMYPLVPSAGNGIRGVASVPGGLILDVGESGTAPKQRLVRAGVPPWAGYVPVEAATLIEDRLGTIADHICVSSDVVVAWDRNGNFPHYHLSDDGGLTFQQIATPDGLRPRGIARMQSGRWVAFFQSGSTRSIYYSDQDAPESWTSAFSGTGTHPSGRCIAAGRYAYMCDNIRRVWRSEDGVSWAHVGIITPANPGSVQLALMSNGNVLAFGSNGYGEVALSSDDGVTWSAVSLGSPGSILNVSESGGVAVGSSGESSFWVSDDFGATWTIHMPPFSGYGNAASVAVLELTDE